MNKKILYAPLFLLLTGLFTQCGKSNTGGYNNPPPGGGTGNNISISGMTFSPSSKTVAKGTVVKWVNNDNYSTHTATSNDGTTFDTGDISSGGSKTYTANTAGTFEYHCKIHGMSMSGTLIVTP